ncbi:MAG: glycosyltransferase family 4 protein [Kiritimatiellae bacterium]|nr:glycosyltransferase family 4 protein [Kiritimatiellia bacterium]
MTVWIVNPFDNLPAEGFRPQRYWLMSEAFAAAGHNVTFWTQDWSHAAKSRRHDLSFSAPFAIKFVHVPGYGRNIGLKRIWSHWRFARNWFSMAKKCEEKPHLVIVSSPPLCIGEKVREFCGSVKAEYIVDMMDAWPETFERVVPRWSLFFMRQIAKKNYLSASAITAVTKSYLELARKYGAHSPMRLFYHGIKMTETPDGKISGGKVAAGPIRLVYAGNMSLSYDLATVVDAVKSDESLVLDIAGSGPDEASLKLRASGCPRIRFHGYLKEDELRSLLGRADAGLVPMFDDSCVGVPYKLADYAAAGLPVASSLHGETAELLERFNAGVTYSAGDVAGFSAAVRQASAIGRGKTPLVDLFDSRRLYAEYVEFATSLCGENNLKQKRKE